MGYLTSRLYYENTYLREFDAQILEQFNFRGAVGVVLDQTAFYPTSGGQPHDTGSLNGQPVLDVFERESDQAIVHIVPHRLETRIVHGVIDWPRRFDLMQQHTGQHILSHAFEALLDAGTVGFHLTEDHLTIDIHYASSLTQDALQAVEMRANEIVCANLPVTTAFYSRDDATRLPLRRLPNVSGPIRVVCIGDVDYSPCGGTHLAASGSVGQILIRKIERRGDETRIDFVCGYRALAEARRKNQLVNELAAQLSVGEPEILNATMRLQNEVKACHKHIHTLEDKLLDFESREILLHAEKMGKVYLIKHLFTDRDPNAGKHLAVRLISMSRCVVLFGVVQNGRVQFTFARSEDLAIDVRPLLQNACVKVGGGGGGQANIAQGGGYRPEEAWAALEATALTVQHYCLSAIEEQRRCKK